MYIHLAYDTRRAPRVSRVDLPSGCKTLAKKHAQRCALRHALSPGRPHARPIPSVRAEPRPAAGAGARGQPQGAAMADAAIVPMEETQIVPNFLTEDEVRAAELDRVRQQVAAGLLGGPEHRNLGPPDVL